MKRIIVLNSKGGCGKTTLATNLASCYAVRGCVTALIDYDPQGSSLQWVNARAQELPRIHGVALQESGRIPLSGAWQLRVPRDTQRVVVDTPAGIRAVDLAGRITPQDMILIPIQPSVMDIRATSDFIRDLLLGTKLRPQDRRIALVGNRVRRQGAGFQTLERFLASLSLPVLSHLSDAACYGTAVERGLGIFELPPLQVRRERRAWESILAWVEPEGSDAIPVARSAPARGPDKPHVPAFLTTAWDGTQDPDPRNPKRLN